MQFVLVIQPWLIDTARNIGSRRDIISAAQMSAIFIYIMHMMHREIVSGGGEHCAGPPIKLMVSGFP